MLWGGSASAANLSGTRCEDKSVVSFIKDSLRGMTIANGERFSKYLKSNSKVAASTVSARKDRFTCRVALTVSVAGRTEQIKGRFVYREYANGKASIEFTQN
jgi:hypothetical protein